MTKEKEAVLEVSVKEESEKKKKKKEDQLEMVTPVKSESEVKIGSEI